MRDALIDSIFEISSEIRYVAVYLDGALESRERGGLANASSSESDKYEELIVNPSILTLATQRGNIDCGGCRWIVIGYGSFHEVVIPVRGGHLSVGVELAGRPVELVDRIFEVAERSGVERR